MARTTDGSEEPAESVRAPEGAWGGPGAVAEISPLARRAR
jgi:hypothetical protein